MTLEHLENNALWIIMDPWEKTPYEEDLVKCPELDTINHRLFERIAGYVPKLNRVFISCSLISKVHPSLSHVKNLFHNFDLLKDYVIANNITDIVYMGLHHGRCILNRPTGAMYVHKELPNVKLWLKTDFVEILPWDDVVVADNNSKQFMTFV